MQGTFFGCEEVTLKFEIETKEHIRMLAEYIKKMDRVYGWISITGFNLVTKVAVKKPRKKTYTLPSNILNGK